MLRASTQIAAIRGAGLSFLIASMLFLFFGQASIFFLVLVGALVGFGIGEFLAKNPGIESKIHAFFAAALQSKSQHGGPAQFLGASNVLIRFLRLGVIGLGLFLVTWMMSYYLLPERVFRAGAEAQMARGALNVPSGSMIEEWGKIFSANLLPVILILGGSWLMRVNGIPFGYLIVLFNIAGYGLFLGSNSMAIPMPVRMAPSPAVLGRSGPYEMIALMLIAASSFSWSFFEIKQLFRTNPEKVQFRARIKWQEMVGVSVGIGLLIAANAIEAAMVMASASIK